MNLPLIFVLFSASGLPVTLDQLEAAQNSADLETGNRIVAEADSSKCQSSPGRKAEWNRTCAKERRAESRCRKAG